MRLIAVVLSAVALGVLLGAAPAPGQTSQQAPAEWKALPDANSTKAAREMFRSLYGKELKRVLGTAEGGDDLVLASELLGAARLAGGQPALLELLCEESHDLAARVPAGSETAVRAMEALAAATRKFPARVVDCREKIVAVRLRQLSAAQPAERAAAGAAMIAASLALADAQARADDLPASVASCNRALVVARSIQSPDVEPLAARVKWQALWARSAESLKEWKARLKETPDDQAARDQVIRLYVTEMDNPAAAAKLLSAGCDQAMRTYVPLAAKDPNDLPAAACLELGEWYRVLSDKASEFGRPKLLRRAQACYRRFLAENKAQDITALKAKLGLKRVEEALEKVQSPPLSGKDPSPGPAPPAWRPLFNGKDLTGWTSPTGGQPGAGWVVQKGVLIRKGAGGNLWTAERFGDFILELEFNTTGNSGVFFRVDRPIDCINTGFEVQILESFMRGVSPNKSNGSIYDCQAPRRPVTRRPGEWSRLVLTCAGSKVTVAINGTAVTEMDLDRWDRPGVNPDGSRNPKPAALKDMKREGHIGLQDWNDVVAFRNIRIKPLDRK